ncbi:small subunit processome component 20 homolog isoform X1 [Rhagoletis pomonella]|uniref:small subunit processome component 20 homolog isoform X1 n=1 Tax=Rhagoletis pomonella TaxID=28610 RepID=UPI0017830F1F|nr:small subunit processome component 20 homolog isoform X1 [Rhagoletis pomonella]
MAEILQKTKNSNTFRFKSFADRVGEIDIRRLALYRIGHQNEELPEEENETYFHQTLKKWMVLNLTDEFGQFSRRCLKVVTLPQLVHQKDFVIDLLLERLSTATNLALQPLLELLYVLARDLREDFYPYFQRVLDRLICLLNTQDAEQLEWTLVCLAYLFKTLKPYLKKNIGVIFHAILPLLDEQRYEEHVTNFAVECFSFIARDVRDYRKFLDFVLHTVAREQVDSIAGCGRLLFEIVRGVKGQFHSVAGDFLQFIFECLVDEQRTKGIDKLQLLCEIVQQSVQELLNFILPQNMSLYWNKLCDVAQNTMLAGVGACGRLAHILPLFIMAAQHKNGRHLCELDVVVPTILKMLDYCMQSHSRAYAAETLKLLMQLVSKVLLANNVHLTQLDTSRLMKKALSVQQRDIYAQFVLLIAAHAQFELLVLPSVVANFEQHFDEAAFELMARVVLLKRPLAGNAFTLESWQPYMLHIKQQQTLEKIKQKFTEIDLSGDTLNGKENCLLEQILLLILLPHVVALEKEPLEVKLNTAMGQILEDFSIQDNLSCQLTIFSLLLETHIHLKFKSTPEFLQRAVQVLLPHATSNLQALGALDQLLTVTAKLPSEDVLHISELLTPLLSSHSHDVRLLTAHCLQTLHRQTKNAHPYKIFYQAECIEPNVHNYREQLLYLQQLEPAGELYRAMDKEESLRDVYKQHILRFLLGMLYHNFKFVWEPVQKLIESYALLMSLADFWNIYKQQLQLTAERIDYTIAVTKDSTATVENVACWRSDVLNEVLPAAQPPKQTQQQLLNYRNLLWMRLPLFGQMATQKNRDLVGLFLQFVNEEYRARLERRELTWDLTQTATGHGHEQLAEAGVLDSDDEADEDIKQNERQRKIGHRNKQRKDQQGFIAKSILQTLQSKLGVFAAQPNPRSLYREPELYTLYMDLLAGPNAQLQRAALDCVLRYKSKSLTPHKEHLYALVDEVKLKDELVNFKLDETVSAEERPELMKILLRILYGKMITKGTQRAMSAQSRKSMILRFLGQCTTDEILWFLEMAFGKYSNYTAEDATLEQIPAQVQSDFDLHAVWSPKKLQSIVNLLELIRKEFGGLMKRDFHIYMLKLLTFVGSACNAVLLMPAEKLALVHPKMSVVYKNVRNNALLSLVNFFAHIEEFDWEASQVRCLSEVYVWPAIEKLPNESIHTPTPLLRLLLQWGEKPQHFDYLAQRRTNGAEQAQGSPTIFHYVVTLLLNEKAKTAVRRPIMALVERLLASAASDNTFGESAGISGLHIVKPYIPELLKRLRMNFSTRAAKKAIDKRDLNILSLLTAHVEDADTCDSLLQLLLPILIAKSQRNANEEVVTQVITTLANLIKQLNTPEMYLRKLAPLFEQTQEVNARKLLCQLVTDIARKRHKQAMQSKDEALTELATRLQRTARLTCMLNAWDKRWVEQPDYDKRLAALKEIAQLLDAECNGVDLELSVLVIYNCVYFIKYDKDMGLRDNASEHLRLLLPRLALRFAAAADDKPNLDYLVGDVTINLLRRLLRDKNDNVRYEGIRLLGEMARQAPSTHPILQDLAPLGDPKDAEVDFFENLTHLQTHRHGRALLRFCAHAQTIKLRPYTRTLTEFILPLATRYLLQEKHASKHTLIDAAIETVGVVCQLLPWQQYHALLRYYLTKLRSTQEYQRQCVRIVVHILDAFHFDLTQAQADAQALQQLRNKLIGEGLNEEVEEEGKKVEKAVKNESVGKASDGDEEDCDGDEKEEDDNEDESVEAELAAELAAVDVESAPTRIDSQSSAPAPCVLSTALLLPAGAAKRVMLTITTILIPTLNRAITEQSSYDNKHKLNRKRFSAEREEEEILRVPIALALVKLMQKLPKELMNTSLPGVFMKVCTFLRSPLKSVRMLTRDILKKIMLTLGASYLSMLMDHLQSLLTRGFQVHVLAVTVHGVLDALREKFQPADVESCLHNLLDVALNDIFGDINAEKEIDKLTAHTPEAKPSAKSYLVLHILARNIQDTCLLDLLMPFKEHLTRSHSRKVTLKIQDCFAKIVSGLAENAHISRESLLIFIYGTVSESITDLLPGTKKRSLTEQEKEYMRRARPDCFIIQPPPRFRSGAINKRVQSNAQANAHVLIEFGLELLQIVLKRKKLLEVDYQPFLNPLLPLLRDALKSTHVRVVTFALKCFAAIWNDAYELPALQQQYLCDVVERMFEILKNISTFGAIKQDENLQLVKSSYKAIVALLRKCTAYELSPEQLQQLVLYVEQNLFEGEHQALSFSLLKALIGRHVEAESLHQIMKRIGDLSVVSQSDFVRDEARSILVVYIMEYPLKKRVDQIVKFFTVQLRYSLPSGRQSVIKFLHTLIKKFPLKMLSKRAEFLYISLGPRLVNDDDPGCRKAIAECIELLIMRLEKVDRQRLFDMTLLFFEPGNNPSVVEMAASLCSRFLNAEKQSFAPRLKLVLPTIVARLTLNNPSAPGRFVRAPTALGYDVDEEKLKKRRKYHQHPNDHGGKKFDEIILTEEEVAKTAEERQRAIDHEIIQIQYCLLKMLDYCSAELLSGNNSELSHVIDELAYESQKLLAHEHAWVRCNAAKIIALILANYDYTRVGAQLAKEQQASAAYTNGNSNDANVPNFDFIYTNPTYDIKSLVLDLCAQVVPGETQQNMIDEIVKIFLFIGNILRDVPFSVKQEKKEDDAAEQTENADTKQILEKETGTKINLYWLVRNIRFLINREVTKTPHATAVRSALFTLIEGLITLLSVETLERLAPLLLGSLVREMSEEDQNIDTDLRQQALRVGSRLRKRIGADVYDKLRTHVQTNLMRRRAERKKLLAQEKIHDPLRAAKRKAATQERKKSAKRLKADLMRGKVADTKQKLKKRKRKSEEELL